MTREAALENAVKLLLVENDCLREACGQGKLTNGNRDFPAAELARGADFPGLIGFSFEGTLSVRMES
jgi:hypothetical protein